MPLTWKTGKLFVENLDTLDCAIYSEAHGICGASWYVDIEIEGTLDGNGFVYDFSLTKKLVKETLKSTLDHTLILPKLNSNITATVSDNNRINVQIFKDDELWVYKAPKQAVYLLDTKMLSSDLIANALQLEIKKVLPANVTEVKITLREEQSSDDSSFFRYTHGLPNHIGLCQRLFHGHKSKVKIYKDDALSSELEKLVANKWFSKSIHIAEPSQFKTKSWEPYKKGPTGEKTTLCYQAAEGYFEATIPSNRIYIVEQATSIESIAKGLCKQLKDLNPDSTIKVMPFEGISKGGVASL